MDKLDIDLLKILQENARITISEISKKIALSRPSITERILRLQEKGIIEEFTARVSLGAINRGTILFIQLSSLKATNSDFEQMIIRDEAVLECHRVTGNTSYFIKAAVKDMSSMKALIDRLMPYGDINTTIVLESPVPYRHIVPKVDDI
ncbi:MAG: transcriptional regulator, AsnC family [Clostridia bacterium]|jgi:Lrp/AsnC family leucine-responsive transcriptional regulator|nr:transcriptional regulator, AsnC family [Clostridia bacterium]